ncbi:ABC transporter ATP-binding protein [Tistrella bauzanensis]|uniref:ABC transporter ATP-binding protein n=1 Tax=Tistrella bauzanensis TaxID=657419 RepID=A0ABQ1IHS2_9PROT|nr:urea ABC transporter ATP-binding subunit UrtE [Tistrella bauzanensis]GGB38651.1 ABC transporter ATP-binding protein [Tistrella bauzanensis]
MLDVHALDVHYGSAQALKGVSVEARAGEITCVLGRNGVGKTTLMRAITGHLKPSAGTIRLADTDLAGRAPFDRARAGIGFVPQGREVFPLLTVEENLKTGLAARPRSLERRIPDDIFTLFPVLKSMLGRRGGDLSGGQQQQLAIGRALVTAPKLLVLDEPTEGIQPSIIKDIGRVIQLLARERGLAVLLVEQYFDFAQELADRFIVLDRGEVIVSGDGASLDDDVRRHLTV